MKANAKSLRFLGEGKKLEVPFFQRHYVWNEENWDELLQSFENDEVLPFLGSIILKEESAKASTIIDGQQRLTTITILAKAIYDCLSEESKKSGSGIRREIEGYLYYRDNAADDFEDSYVKIAHSRLDCEDYNRVIRAGVFDGSPNIDLATINDTSGNILKCYKHYCSQIKTWGDHKLKDLFNSLFNDDRKVIVLIELEHGDVNEQTIFDTINRAGVRLSTADIINNNLFKRLLEASGSDEERKQKVVDVYRESWDKIFYKTQKEMDLWDEERVFGNVKHSNLEFLLYCVACIKWGEDGDMFAKLEAVFDRATAVMGYNELASLVEEIREYALIFKKYVLDFGYDLNDENKSEYFKYSEGVRRLLLILQKFGVQMFYPYVLKRLKEVRQNENDETLLHDFQVLESFIVRRKISHKGTHDYTSKCYSIIKNGISQLIKDELANQDSEVSDRAVKEHLSETKDEAAKMILFWIELYRRKDECIDVRALEYIYTLEHIMPKKWQEHWSDVPIMQGHTELKADSEEGKAFRDRIIQSIGNKTLLTARLNAVIRNGNFQKKVEGAGQAKPGYRSHTMLLITRELVEHYEQKPVWNEEYILKREKELYDDFLKIWPSFAEEISDGSNNNDSHLWDDILDGISEEALADPVKLIRSFPD